MKFGFALPNSGPLARPRTLTTIAQRAEKLGFHAVSFSDHVVVPNEIMAHYPYSKTGKAGFSPDTLEQLTSLAFIAAKTQSIHIMTSIMVLPYRSPLLAAKMLTTLDVLSGGRLIIGVGTGWMKEEFEALNVPPFEERGSVADEYLQVFHLLWGNAPAQFEGRYSRFSGIDFSPKPNQRPHPPIWVGGESRKAMERAAKFGDGWYPTVNNYTRPIGTIQELSAAIGEFRSLVGKIGRDPEGISLSLADITFDPAAQERSQTLFSGTPADIKADVRKCEKLGISYLGFKMRAPSLQQTMGNMELFTREIIRESS
jgi:probable F420-dependent oxidoreductase